MNLIDIEMRFRRAFTKSFSKKKSLLVFPILFFCSLLFVYARAIGSTLNQWASMSMIFFAMFLTSGVVLALGVLMIRIYYHEVKHLKFKVVDLVKNSFEVMLKACFFSLPFFFAYLVLWTLLGLFLFFFKIPIMGDTMKVFLILVPFILIFTSFVLCSVNLGFLFFVGPFLALRNKNLMSLSKMILASMRRKVISHLSLLLIALFPLFLAGMFLLATVYVIQVNHFFSDGWPSFTLQLFFLSAVFSTVLTPFVIFFFNFSAEAFHALREK